MAAFVTDQFRILNASNFIDSISNDNNSYYAFLGLPNPTATGFGRNLNWNEIDGTPSPVDNFQYSTHYKDTALFGKKINESNAVRVVRKIDWVQNNAYDMYRHDYSDSNQAPVSKSYRLYDANYYVITSAFRVYICIDNGSTGSISPLRSLVEPTETGVEPFATNDGYRWKYLFTVSPLDIIKFDSTQYIPLPNNWDTNNETQIIYEGGNSETNNNQIKKIYIENGGSGYSNQPSVKILGDGSGGTAQIVTNGGVITGVEVLTGGTGYTYGVVDLSGTSGNGALLIPIIPPSKGHGHDIYQELGGDRVLLYARFDDSDNDFPVDTKFSQIGIIKNPETFSETNVSTGVTYTGNTFSSLYSIVVNESITPTIGDKVEQVNDNGTARGYVASFDSEIKVLKYFQDRSLVFGNTPFDSQVHNSASNSSDLVDFDSSVTNITVGGSGATIDTAVNGTSIITTDDGKLVDAGVTFTNGLANPEINKKTGNILYIDNRPVVTRDSRQKEDIKIILEF